MVILKLTFTKTLSWIVLDAKGFRPSASTPVLAILPKYVKPKKKESAVTKTAKMYRSEVSGVKKGEEAASLMLSNKFAAGFVSIMPKWGLMVASIVPIAFGSELP